MIFYIVLLTYYLNFIIIVSDGNVTLLEEQVTEKDNYIMEKNSRLTKCQADYKILHGGLSTTIRDYRNCLADKDQGISLTPRVR